MMDNRNNRQWITDSYDLCMNVFCSGRYIHIPILVISAYPSLPQPVLTYLTLYQSIIAYIILS